MDYLEEQKKRKKQKRMKNLNFQIDLVSFLLKGKTADNLEKMKLQ